MLKFGMPTLIETKTTQECAALCHELGLDFIEINMNLPQYQTDTMDISLLKEMADRYGISYTVHLDENMNVCDFNTSVSEAYREMVVESIGLAKQLNIPVLNMHLNYGVFFTLPDRKVYLFEEYRDDYFARLRAFRDACTHAIGDSDIRICIENTSTFSHPIGEESLTCLLESPAFAVTFDTGHDAARNFTQRQVIDRHIARLYHMHLTMRFPPNAAITCRLVRGFFPLKST